MSNKVVGSPINQLTVWLVLAFEFESIEDATNKIISNVNRLSIYNPHADLALDCHLIFHHQHISIHQFI